MDKAMEGDKPWATSDAAHVIHLQCCLRRHSSRSEEQEKLEEGLRSRNIWVKLRKTGSRLRKTCVRSRSVDMRSRSVGARSKGSEGWS